MTSEDGTPADTVSALAPVYWIGGGSGAGKSTIARRIAAAHGFRLYPTDDVMSDHARRSTAENAPFLSRFMAMDLDERWVNRSPAVMLESFHWFRGEGFELIVDDLPASEGPVVAEGFRLLPHLVQPLLSDPHHAVWLLPTPDFRMAAFESRGTAWEIPNRTTAPQRARHNLLERDRMFTDRLAEQARALGLPVIEVDRDLTEDELTAQVTRSFGL